MDIQRLKQFISVVALGLYFAVSLFAQDGIVSVTSETSWHGNAVDNAFMNAQIADAAVQYKQYPPIARIAFYDIGYPKTKAEFEALNGYGILLVSALSQDGNELPIKRAYIASEGKQFDLVKLKEIFVKNPDLKSQAVKTVGQYRVDSLYLFPVYMRFQLAELLIDFTKNRTNMKLAAFDTSVPNNIKYLPTTRPKYGKANDEAMRIFLKREYPGYTEK